MGMDGLENDASLITGEKQKVLIFIVCFNDEKSIELLLQKIPKEILDGSRFDTEILIIDNRSSDRTFFAACDFAAGRSDLKLVILYNPKSRGYGANQKIGFRYAIDHGFDAIVLLHGDNRYPPQRLPEMARLTEKTLSDFSVV